MQHLHVRVYTGDHADAVDLLQDYRCEDLAEARRRIHEFIRDYADQIGAETGGGVGVDFEQGDVVTLWPQDATRRPVHLTIQLCEQPHDG